MNEIRQEFEQELTKHTELHLAEIEATRIYDEAFYAAHIEVMEGNSDKFALPMLEYASAEEWRLEARTKISMKLADEWVVLCKARAALTAQLYRLQFIAAHATGGGAALNISTP